MKNLALVVMVLFSTGCASTYELSKEALTYRAGISEAQALAMVNQNIPASGEQKGVCSAHTFYQFATVKSPHLEGNNLVFTSYYSESKGVYSTPGGARGSIVVHSVQGETKEGKWKVDLKNISKIRVLDNADAWGCGKAKGHIVLIGESGVGEGPNKDGTPAKASNIMMNVSPGNLDRLVAALSVLSPDAKLLHGAGL